MQGFHQSEDTLPQVIHKSIKGAFDQTTGELSQNLADKTEQLGQSLVRPTQLSLSGGLSNSMQHPQVDNYSTRIVDGYQDQKRRKLNVICH